MFRCVGLALSLLLIQISLAASHKTVQVYFFNSSSETEANPLGLVAVGRQVPAAAPARPAIEALLGGPSETERAKGFRALDSHGLRLQKLVNRGGAWTVYFVSAGGKTWPGTLSPARFEQAVKRTMLQFPTVKSVTVYVDGRSDFASGRG